MKKFLSMAALIAASFMMSSCFGGGAAATTALGTLASAAAGTGNVANTNNGGLLQNGGGMLGSLLSSLLGNATTNKNTIIGTWTYKAPEVRFESENVLSQIGGTMASNKIQTMLGSQLTKIGFTEGKSSFTFAKDGSLTVTMGNKTTTGTYTYDDKAKTVTMTGAMGLTNVTCTVAVTGNMMYMLFDASKLLSIAAGMSGSNSATSSLGALLGNYSGMKMGWSMSK